MFGQKIQCCMLPKQYLQAIVKHILCTKPFFQNTILIKKGCNKLASAGLSAKQPSNCFRIGETESSEGGWLLTKNDLKESEHTWIWSMLP